MQNEGTENLSPKEVKDLQSSLRYLFVNYPVERLKTIHWELYRAWVLNSAETVSPEEISDMLIYYEVFEEHIDDLYRYCQHLNKTALKDIPIEME